MSGNAEGGGNWKAQVLCKIIVVKFVLVSDPSRDTLKGKRVFSRGARVLPWGLRVPIQPHSRSWCYFEPPLPQGFPTGLWQALERRSTQFSTVPMSLSLHSLGKKGSAGFWRGKRRALQLTIPWLAPCHTWAQITVAHRDLCYRWHTQIGTNRKSLACLGLEFSSLGDISVLWKGNAIKYNSREERVVWSDSLLKKQSLRLHWHFITSGTWGYQSMIKYHTLSPCRSIIIRICKKPDPG